jgi:hypothetical protein
MPLHEAMSNEGRDTIPGGSNPKDIGGRNPGNDPDAGVVFAATTQPGAPLGAASGVETGGTANEPAPDMEMDWGGGGAGMGASGTDAPHARGDYALGGHDAHPIPNPHRGGPTHPATGYATSDTTGGMVQHPRPSNLTSANSTGGTGEPEGNAQGLENPGATERQGMVGAGQGSGTSPQGGGQDQSPLVEGSGSDAGRDQSMSSAT